MTEIRLGSKLTRKTAAVVQRKPLVVILHSGYLEIRRAGTRTAFPISYESIYTHAARIAADRVRVAKWAAKTAKKKGRS